jgi:hypothetical protein
MTVVTNENDACQDMLHDIRRMDIERPDLRYRNIVDNVPMMLAMGLTYAQIERSYKITILPQDRLPPTATAE